MRILNKRNFVDCLWFIYIAIAIFALDSFHAQDHFIAIGGGNMLTHGFTGIFSANHLLPLLFLLQYVLAIYLIYISTRIDVTIGFLFMVIIWGLMVADLSFQDVIGRQAEIINIALLNGAMWHVKDIISEYVVSIIVQVIVTALLFIPLIRKAIKDQRVTRKFHLFLWPFVVMFMLYVGIFMYKGEMALAGYPKGFSYGFGTVSLQLNRFFKQMQTADPFEVKKVTEPVAEKIIVVIDNSVSYEELLVTGAHTLPGVIDYGSAFSAANCTATSNFVIRKAGWVRNGTGEVIVKGIESLFSLALKADYKTALVDNDNVLDDPFTKNYFDEFEIRDIQYQVAGEDELYKRDLASVETIPSLLERKKIFVMINKVGTHFPYSNTLPPNAASGRKIYNYKKSLVLNTKDYLEKLINTIDEDTVVFYTSDHGQNLKGAIPDCNTGKEIRRAEYAVPFLVITKNAGVKKLLLARRSVYANKMTHLEFSESIRNMMGYAVDDIDSIFKPAKHLNKIYCGLYGPPYTIMDAKPQCRGLK